MKRSDLTEKLLDIKREKGWSWKHICEQIGGYSEVLIVGAILGQMKLTKPQAANAAELLRVEKERGSLREGLSADLVAMPADPLSDIENLRKIDFVMKDGKVVRKPAGSQ